MLEKDGFPVKVYVNSDDSRCAVFPLFGRYHTVSSDKSALDLCIQILFHRSSDYDQPCGVVSFAQYQSSQEDTAVIFKEAA